jgi:phage portal protein BeeE
MGFKQFFGMKEQVEVKAEAPFDSSLRVPKSDDIFKAYIPNFLYKPPFGMPRRDNPVQYKELAKNPYIFSITKTLQNEAATADWEIKVKEEFIDSGVQYEDKIKEITRFLKNPNKNEQSFKHIIRQLISDLLETDSAVLVKVFNRSGEFKQIFARDGSLFLKNPDIYGYMGDRADFVMPLPDGFTGLQIKEGTPVHQQMMNQYELLYKDQAAYFQYGWTAGSMPVPFGKREIIYMMQHPRADSIYGTSPISRVIDLILNLVYGMEFNLDFYTNNNMPDGIVSLLGANQAQIKQYRENMDAQFKFKDALGNIRKKFFKVPITSVDAKFTPFSMTSKEMEVIAQQEWFTKVLWMCFGVNADEMGFTENSNKSVGEEQIKTFKRKAVVPLLDIIQYHLNTQLITEFFDGIEYADCPLEFVFDTYDIDEDIKTHTLLEQQIRMGIKTPQMVAEELGIDFKEVEATTPEEPEEDDTAEEEPKMEEKAQPKENPLKEIEQHLDNIRDDITKAMGDLDERELRI